MAKATGLDVRPKGSGKAHGLVTVTVGAERLERLRGEGVGISQTVRDALDAWWGRDLTQGVDGSASKGRPDDMIERIYRVLGG